MDGWFEEDEEIFAHPRDPHHRVDVLRSSRHVQIEVDGITVADTHSPVLLFETTLPIRFYLPKTDVRMDLLTPNNDSTQCPYKGTARSWNLDSGRLSTSSSRLKFRPGGNPSYARSKSSGPTAPTRCGRSLPLNRTTSPT